MYQADKADKVTWHASELCQAGIPFIRALGVWGIAPPDLHTSKSSDYIFKAIEYKYSLHSKNMGRNSKK